MRKRGLLVAVAFFLLVTSAYKSFRVVEHALRPHSEKGAIGQFHHPIMLYTDRLSFSPGDSVIVFVNSKKEWVLGTVFNLAGGKLIPIRKLESIPTRDQAITFQDAVSGCQWGESASFPAPSHQGYYQLHLYNGRDTAKHAFIISKKRSNTSIAVFANTTTWVAYNQWGGKSFYQNLESTNLVTTLSTLRPNLSFQGSKPVHNLTEESNVYHWLQTKYAANLFPDYAPYRLAVESHWLLRGISLPQDRLFGRGGITGRALSGLETDKRSLFSPAGTKLIAQGVNPHHRGAIFPDTSYRWDGAGGAEMD